MTSVAAARLERPELTALVDELARRFGEGIPASVSVHALDDAGLGALADLLGADQLPMRARRLSVTRLTTALGLENVDELRATVEVLRGPIPDRRAHRAGVAAEREALWSWFATAVEDLGERHHLEGWATRVRQAGLRGGIDQHRHRLESAVAVLGCLPADGTTLAALASDLLGDPHALDRGRSVAALVVDALAGPRVDGTARDAETVRSAWERAGVAPDVLSSTTLVLGLRPPADHPIGPHLRAAADASEPVVLTLGQLRRWPLPPLAADSVAFVVENPSVVAEAARRRWADGPALICSSGRPTVAVVTLVRQLGAAGATILQHADFDEAGIAITGWLAERAATQPWMMDGPSYHAAVAAGHGQVSLTNATPPTPWDPSLAELMDASRVAIYEEALRDQLIECMFNIALRP